MKVTRVRVTQLAIPLDRSYWMSLEPYTSASEVLVEIDSGSETVGLGVCHGRPMGLIAQLVVETLAPIIVGRSPLNTATLWDEMFAVARSRTSVAGQQDTGQPHFGAGTRPQLMAAIAGVDIALWDLRAKLLGVPVYRLLGSGRREIPCYASGGYYGTDGSADVERLVGEMSAYVEAGYRFVKMKVGGLDLEDDLRRVDAVREAVGDDVGMMLDANCAYDLAGARLAAASFARYQPIWFEEPLAWYDDVRGMQALSRSTNIPLASGERALHRWECRDLVQGAGIQVLQFDATRAGGVTEWLRVAAYASAHGVTMAPHHDPQIHAHLLAASDNAGLQETFPNPHRDPIWSGLYARRPNLTGGLLTLVDEPGFGIQLDRDFVVRHTIASWSFPD